MKTPWHRAAGTQDVSALVWSSRVPGQEHPGPDSTRVSTAWLVVPAGPESLSARGCRQVGTVSRRRASLPVLIGALLSWGSGASPALMLACISFTHLLPQLPAPVHRLIPSLWATQRWTQTPAHWGLRGAADIS